MLEICIYVNRLGSVPEQAGIWNGIQACVFPLLLDSMLVMEEYVRIFLLNILSRIWDQSGKIQLVKMQWTNFIFTSQCVVCHVRVVIVLYTYCGMLIITWLERKASVVNKRIMGKNIYCTNSNTLLFWLLLMVLFQSRSLSLMSRIHSKAPIGPVLLNLLWNWLWLIPQVLLFIVFHLDSPLLDNCWTKDIAGSFVQHLNNKK